MLTRESPYGFMEISSEGERRLRMVQGETERRLLTVPQVVYRTSLSRSTIYKEIAAGRLRVVKLGRAVRVPADAFDSWLEDLGRDQSDG
jgi:excisionase family DNA binding protein